MDHPSSISLKCIIYVFIEVFFHVFASRSVVPKLWFVNLLRLCKLFQGVYQEKFMKINFLCANII